MGGIWATKLVILLLIGVAKSTELAKCIKAFPSGTPTPDDELMNAFYLADPDPDTGYLSLTSSWNGDVNAMMVSETIDYNTWLARNHSAEESMTHLWSYLNNLIVSNVFEIYAHYKVVDQVGTGGTKPRGIMDLGKLSTLFYNTCSNFNAVKDTWPFTCFDANIFCYLQYTIDSMKQIVKDSYWNFDNGQFTLVENFKSMGTIDGMSKLGIDRNQRSYALEYMFQSDVIKYISSDAQASVFYHSRIVWEALEKLIGSKSSFDSWITNWQYVGFESVEYHVQRECSEHSTKPVGILYYCKAKEYTEKVRACSELTDVTPCVYDSLIQEYFTKGRFGSYNELSVVKQIITKTQTVMTQFKDKVVAQDRTGLNNLLTVYTPYITVDDSMCVIDWPNAFDCVKNFGCGSILDEYQFDCNGGYTCRINMMYRFDCMVKFVLKQTQQLIDVATGNNWGSSNVKKAKYDLMIWLSYLPMAGYASLDSTNINDVIKNTQETVNNYVTSYDTAGLKSFASNLPSITFAPQWAKDAACQTTSLATEYKIFCNLDPLLNSVFLFIDAFENARQTSVKVLNPTVDYRILLEQLQLDRVSQYINLQTQSYFNDLTSQLEDNFGSLSDYFSSLADYDKTKAEADIAYIDGRLILFKSKITELTIPVENMFSTVLKFAIGANVAGILQRTAEVAVAISQVAHPGNQILGGSSILDLMGTINALAQEGVQSALLGQLGEQAFPDLVTTAQTLGGNFLENEEQLLTAKELIDTLKSGSTDAVGVANTFLGLYNDYDPKVLLSDITAYGSKFETVAEQVCESAFSGETAAQALIEIGLASTGECTKIGSAIAELITVYEEFYDYQFDLMDSLSDAARAYLAYQKANELQLIYTSGARVDDAFLQHTAVNTFMVSTLNVWEVVTEYCDMLTYTSGGAVPTKCSTALDTPSHHAVAQVIAYSPDPLCHVNNEITDYRDIPITAANSGDTAFIDLEELYKGEVVNFKIPSFQWLRDNDWVGPQDTEKAMYIKRFELFLTPMTGSQQHTVELNVEPSMANYLTQGGTKYLLPVSGYTARYTENSFNCYHDEINNPYALCQPDDLVKLCITSNGYVDRNVQPSIYNEWKIQATSLPTGQVTPSPVTNFKLQAGVTMCVVDLAAKKKRDTLSLAKILKTQKGLRQRRGTQHCCTSSQYWNGAACANCPSGSSQQLNGYYCQ